LRNRIIGAPVEDRDDSVRNAANRPEAIAYFCDDDAFFAAVLRAMASES
jgi:hypothetical protein